MTEPALWLVTQADAVAFLPESIRHDFTPRLDPILTRRIVIGTPPRALVIGADGVKPFASLDYHIVTVYS